VRRPSGLIKGGGGGTHAFRGHSLGQGREGFIGATIKNRYKSLCDISKKKIG